MAFNSFEKFEKTQSLYPNPKSAQQELNRRLKKHPNDPYLLVLLSTLVAYTSLILFVQAWQVELAAVGPSAGLPATYDKIDQIFERNPPITDIQFISHLYHLQHLRLVNTGNSVVPPASGGKQILTSWENAAKSFKTRNGRLAFWNTLFSIAVQLGLWEDARVVRRMQPFLGFHLATAHR
jgi:N-terminal acetyltransferase B complex non-catalytic subunit